MKCNRLYVIVFLIILFQPRVFAHRPLTWQEGEQLSPYGHPNPYDFRDEEFTQYRKNGLLHALTWPVGVTGVVIPYESTQYLMGRLQSKLGLHDYPSQEGEGPYYVPYPNGVKPKYKMGLSILQRNNAAVYTFSCAGCHSGKIFGKTVMGMTNRFPGANELFVEGIKWSKNVTPSVYKTITGASSKDVEVYRETRKRLNFVEARKPVVKGLDTSLAHVALSLSHRAPDEFASMVDDFKKSPRKERLRTTVADSKPAVWWNVRFKNKWLSDGSVVSGNPILTNLLWNEIGRGTDLFELQEWLQNNQHVIQELTTAVYGATPPKITDFFKEKDLDFEAAKRGEKIFRNKCMQCHGEYEKAWNRPSNGSEPWHVKFETLSVKYFPDTPVRDVGTDPLRRQGMASLTQLNHLAISKANGIMVREQNGYVPPPLIGIWVRFPYLHNNSIPNLCEFLKPANKRVKSYYAGEVENKNHFDVRCNGYPTKNVPLNWKLSGVFYDTKKPGQSNLGHDQGFAEFTDDMRYDLIRYLQTL